MSALLAVLLTLPLPAADPCADVFDRTERCASVDVEALATPVDPVPPLAAPADERSDLGLALGWRFLAGSAVVAVLAGAVGIGSVVFDARAMALEEAGATTAAEENALYRTLAQGTAGGLLLLSGLFAGTSVAFLVFDPTEGRAREPFRIEE